MVVQQFLKPLLVLAVLGVSGCIETPQGGLPTTAQTKYSRVAVLPSIGDRVTSTYWKAALATPEPVDGTLGWKVSAEAASLVRAQLAPAGARVTPVTSLTGSAARQNDIVLVIEQTPLNILGEAYNPGRTFLGLGGGLFALAAMAEEERTRDEKFQPRFVLWVRNPDANKALIGENACTVGLAATLVDPATGAGVTERVQVKGRTIIPGPLSAPDWRGMPKSEKARVMTACRSALQSAVSQALLAVGIVK